ncbi:MAG: hypothetical protein AB1324_01725 [Candidatus Micrarchaeota archaeon]
MRVLCKPPSGGKRERLCSSDEAEVSLMLSGRMKGMVERLQAPGRDAEREGTFSISDFGGGDFVFMTGPSRADYHVLKALSLCLAGELFPGGFVDIAELRLSGRGGGIASASYSSLVPDESGVIGRRREAMERFYAAEGREAREDILFDADFEERRRNPMLRPLAGKAWIAGLRVPHPEANYHVSGGRTVFFEVDAIDMRRALAAAARSPESDATGYLAQIYAVVIKAWLGSLAGHDWPARERGILDAYGRMGIGELSSFVRAALGSAAREFLGMGPEFWRREPELWMAAFRAYGGKPPGEPAMPAGIDPGVFLLP